MRKAAQRVRGLGAICALVVVAGFGGAHGPAGLLALADAGADTAVATAESSTGLSFDATAALDPRPTPFPDRIVLTWNDDPATTQAVTWRTDASVDSGFAFLMFADSAPEAKDVRRFEATTTSLEASSGLAHYHSVVFRGLLPGTRYAYRVGSDAGLSEWFLFRTADLDPGTETALSAQIVGFAPFTFLYMGDAQNDHLTWWSRTIRAAYAAAPDARFIVHAGDLVSHGDDDAQWEAWFQAGGWIHAMLPCIPAPGNHEYLKSTGKKGPFTSHWREVFTLPENGIPGLEEANYFLDYQGVRIVTLNTYQDLPAQAEWLERVLSDNPNRWTVAAFHYPIYSGYGTRNNAELRALVKPILEKHHVDLVLTGHDHVYARGQAPVGDYAPGDSTSPKPVLGTSGPVYVISVSGPKQYEVNAPWAKRYGENVQLYQIIHVSADTLRYESRTVTGELYDAFDLVKQEDGAARVVERAE